jgi:RHS repeat-associated protein
MNWISCHLSQRFHFYITDHLGSVRAILDVDGNIKSTHDFEPFGVELQPLSDESTNLKYKYTGQERDYSTDLDYMHFRFYASAMGRFLKPDNLIPDITNPQNWNAYSYVKGNPVNFNNPSGHMYRQSGHYHTDYAPWMGISETPELEEYLWGGAGGGGAGVVGSPGNTISNLLLGFDTSSLESSDKDKFEDALLALNATDIGRGLLDFIGRSGLTIKIEVYGKSGLGLTVPILRNNEISGFKMKLQFGTIYPQDSPEEYGVSFKQFSKLGYGKQGATLKLAELLGHELAHVVYDLKNPAKAIEKANIEMKRLQNGNQAWEKLRYETEHFAYETERELLYQLRGLVGR